MNLAERFPESRIPSNIERFGNCSSGSIPLLICSECAADLLQGCTAALFGFGAGWQWAGAFVDFQDVQAVELVEVL
jgi:3-oxoacyl-[acyl-carrier-protein] synthase-3